MRATSRPAAERTQQGNLENPYGTALLAPPNNPKASDLNNYLPNASTIVNDFGQPISLGVYDRTNKLPYTMNYTLDFQWQPRNDVAIEIGYVGNLRPASGHSGSLQSTEHRVAFQPNTGRRPFQQNYSYGYNVGGAVLDDGSPYLANYEGGNVDLRVPYIGYAAESISYVAAGVDAYNALQVHVDKRMSHGMQVGASYTYSHALDEQSGLGLFYNGNNPLNLREAYGSADFDRTHVLNLNYVFRVPDFARKSLAGRCKFVNGWSLMGLRFCRAASPTASSTSPAQSAASTTPPRTASPTPSFRWRHGCTAKKAITGALRRVDPSPPGKPAPGPSVLHLAPSAGGRAWRRDPLFRSI